MTDRERFNRQMHYQSVDRCFNMEFGYWDENFTEWPLFVENNITNNWEADIFFNFDRVGGVGGNVWLSPSFEHKVIGVEGNRRILQNGDGLLAEVPLDGYRRFRWHAGRHLHRHDIHSDVLQLDGRPQGSAP